MQVYRSFDDELLHDASFATGARLTHAMKAASAASLSLRVTFPLQTVLRFFGSGGGGFFASALKRAARFARTARRSSTLSAVPFDRRVRSSAPIYMSADRRQEAPIATGGSDRQMNFKQLDLTRLT